MQASTKNRDGTRRSEACRANEKKAAIAAWDTVRSLISENGIRFSTQNVDINKYGRVLADVFVGDVDVAGYLIENRYPLRYDSSTKAEPDWNRLDQGLMWYPQFVTDPASKAFFSMNS